MEFVVYLPVPQPFGTKPLPESVLIKNYDAILHHCHIALLSHNEMMEKSVINSLRPCDVYMRQ